MATVPHNYRVHEHTTPDTRLIGSVSLRSIARKHLARELEWAFDEADAGSERLNDRVALRLGEVAAVVGYGLETVSKEIRSSGEFAGGLQRTHHWTGFPLIRFPVRTRRQRQLRRVAERRDRSSAQSQHPPHQMPTRAPVRGAYGQWNATKLNLSAAYPAWCARALGNYEGRWPPSLIITECTSTPRRIRG